jgi:hypothetical protein
MTMFMCNKSEDTVVVGTHQQHGTTRKRHTTRNRAEQLVELRQHYFSLQPNGQVIDPLHAKLKEYHDNLLSSVDNVATEKLTAEVAEVVNDMTLIDDINRQFKWTTV